MADPGGERGPVEVFYSYAHEDAALRAEVDTHLAMLRRNRLISQWFDGEIMALAHSRCRRQAA